MDISIMGNINRLTDEELWSVFGLTKELLFERKLIRTKNIVGERGEFLAIHTYNNIPGLPNLQAAPEGTRNIDAISREGERYSVKTITMPNKTTGAFHGICDRGEICLEKKFEFLVVVRLNEDMSLNSMYEFTWKDFIDLKRWHSTMRAWNFSLTKSCLKRASIIYQMKV